MEHADRKFKKSQLRTAKKFAQSYQDRTASRSASDAKLSRQFRDLKERAESSPAYRVAKRLELKLQGLKDPEINDIIYNRR